MGAQFGKSVASNIDPRQLLAALLQSSKLVGGGMQPVLQNMPGGAGMLPDAMIKGAQKFLSKYGEEQAAKAVQTPGGLESLNQVITQSLANQKPEQMYNSGSPQNNMGINSATSLTGKGQTAGQYMGYQAPQEPIAPQPGVPQQPQAPAGNNQLLGQLLTSLGAGLNTYGGGDSSAILSMANQAAERQALAPGRNIDLKLKEQEYLGLKPLQKGEAEKERYKYETEAMNKILDLEKADTADFNKATEEYRLVLPRYATIKELVMNPSAQQANGFGDLAIINETLKIIDPKSVNREGEVKTWKDAESRLARAGVTLSRGWRTGEKLSPEGRKSILKTMTVKYKELEKDAQGYYNQYSNKIKGYGGSPERALTIRSLGREQQASNSGVKITSIKEI